MDAITQMIGHPVTVMYESDTGPCRAHGELLSFNDGALLANGIKPQIVTWIPRERVLFIKRENTPT